MRKKQRFLMPWNVFIIICFAFYIPSLAQESLTQIVKKVKPSVVMVFTYDSKGKILGQGSGFFISKKGDIITNRHVLQGTNRAEIKVAQGEVFPITYIIAEDIQGDLVRAKVNIPEKLVYPLIISSSIPEIGERVIVIGNPLGLEKTVTEGIVSAVRKIPGFGKIIQISAPISPGSSGSPVVNMKGEVIGIATLQMVKGQNLNFAIPSKRVEKLKSGNVKTFAEWREGLGKEWLKSPEGLFYTGLSFLWAKDYEKALSYFEKAVEKNPKNADVWFNIGYCDAVLRQYTEAIGAYKQAIRIKPNDVDAHYNLGMIYDHLGRYTEAIEEFKKAIRIKPDYADAHYNLGLVYGQLGRYPEAIEEYKEVIRIKPDYVDAHCDLGMIYGFLGRHTEAIEEFKEAIRIKPDYADAHYGLGLVYGQLGRYPEAIEEYKEVIRIKPDGVNAHYNLGETYLMLGNTGAALDEYKILKNIDKESANKLFNLIYR